MYGFFLSCPPLLHYFKVVLNSDSGLTPSLLLCQIHYIPCFFFGRLPLLMKIMDLNFLEECKEGELSRLIKYYTFYHQSCVRGPKLSMWQGIQKILLSHSIIISKESSISWEISMNLPNILRLNSSILKT